jgi:hypothetical protein
MPVKYMPPTTHKMPADMAEFLASLNENERRLHQMAERVLGSSYFMDRTHGYTKWQRSKSSAR